jgi:hypothetical protein
MKNLRVVGNRQDAEQPLHRQPRFSSQPKDFRVEKRALVDHELNEEPGRHSLRVARVEGGADCWM